MICSHLSRSVTSRTRCSVCLFLSLLVWLLLILLLSTAFSCNCFGVCFLCCIFYFAPLQLSLSLSLHTHFFALCLFCAFFLLRLLLLLFFDAHTSHWLLFFLSLWPFICPVVVVVAVCIFFAIFSHLLCSVASFVRSFCCVEFQPAKRA